MQRIARRSVQALLTGTALLTGSAAAATLDFSVATHSPAGGVWPGGTARFGVSDVTVQNVRLAAGLSTRAATLGLSRSLALPPVGAATARADVAVTWTGGVQAQARVNGTFGPVALNAGGAWFNTSAARVDPLAPYAFTPTDLREQGWAADLTARYRLSRALVVLGGAEFGAQPQGVLGVEGRRDLTRVLPPAEEDVAAPDPAGAEQDSGTPDSPSTEGSDLTDPPEPAEPETEVTGTLTWRLGARAGREVLGLTGGLTYATPAGLNVGLDALVGPSSFGVTASLDAADVLGEGSSLRVYGAYEPWRTVSLPLRLGAAVTLPAGPGALGVDVRGGRSAAGVNGYGVRVSYTLPLGGEDTGR